MRVYKDWYYNQLKSSYDTMRSSTWAFPLESKYRGNISPKQREEFASSFTLFATFYWDMRQSIGDGCSIDYAIYVAQLWYSMCRIQGPVVFFDFLKSLLLAVRHEARLREYRFLASAGQKELSIVKTLIPFLRRRHTISGFRALHAVVNYLCKMGMSRDGLEESELAAFLECEDRIAGYSDEGIESHLAHIAYTWLRGFKFHCRRGTFSNGSTSTCGSSLLQKCKEPGRLRLDTACFLLKEAYRCNRPRIFPWSINQGGDPVSKVTFVPKNGTHLRTISMEPAIFNYYQNMFDKQLCGYLLQKLPNHFNFDDQTESQLLAIAGSGDGSYATADLSAASDSVSNRLVSSVFRFLPEMREALQALRTQQCLLPDGRLHKLVKFAPMGSRLCFTIETLIFALCCEYACEVSGLSPNQRSYRVYGDDIVIAAAAYPVLVYILEQLGFVVNLTKSYDDGAFREACGAFAYRGRAVTVSSLPRKNLTLYSKDKGSKRLHRLCDASNAHYLDGCSLTAYVLKKEALAVAPSITFLPAYAAVDEADKPEFWLYSDQPTNYHQRNKSVRVVKDNLHCPYPGVETRMVRVPVSKHDYQVNYGRYVFVDTENVYDDADRYLVMLYSMAHNRRELVPGTDLELPYKVADGEKLIDSPVINRWVPLP